MGLNDPWSLKITICGNDLLFTIVIDDHDQRSTICEKDGFNGLRAWGRSSGFYQATSGMFYIIDSGLVLHSVKRASSTFSQKG